MKIDFKSLIISTQLGSIEVPCRFEQVEPTSRFHDFDAVLHYSVKSMWDTAPRDFTIEIACAIKQDYKYLIKQLEERIAKKPQLKDYYGDFILKGAVITGNTMQLCWIIEEKGWSLEDPDKFGCRHARGHFYDVNSTKRYAVQNYDYVVFKPIESEIYW